MPTVDPRELTIREARPEDQDAVIALLRESLGKSDDPHYPAFLRWKHQDNAFGVSPAWLAEHEGTIVGYRTLLRWEFLNDAGRRVRAVRAVDTATLPAYQGLGIFRTLTVRGVADLTRAGDDIVFNTPNDQSRPGYLKMGWTVVRQLPVGVLPASPGALVRMVRSRVPASLWSEETSLGLDARAALADDAFAAALLRHAPDKGFRTNRTPDYLRWRTAFEPLRYRILLAREGDPDAGGVVFRLRRRGESVEAAVIEQLVPGAGTGALLVARILREGGADYAIGLRTGPHAGLLPLPKQGPLLTARPLASAPPARKDWVLTLGDVELF